MQKLHDLLPLPATWSGIYSSSSTLAMDEQKAKQYLAGRLADFEALKASGLTNLGYARLSSAPQGVSVEDARGSVTVCASLVCALAFILARYW